MTVKRLLLIGVEVLGLPLVVLLAQDPSRELIVIANNDTPLPKELTVDEIRNIFVGKIRFEGGTRLYPVNNKDNAIFETFLDKYVGIDAGSYKAYWIKKVFLVGGEPPRLLSRSKEVVGYVSQKKGAIGYVWRKDVRKGVKSVKILAVRP